MRKTIRVKETVAAPTKRLRACLVRPVFKLIV